MNGERSLQYAFCLFLNPTQHATQSFPQDKKAIQYDMLKINTDESSLTCLLSKQTTNLTY